MTISASRSQSRILLSLTSSMELTRRFASHLRLALSLALRDLRGNLRQFVIFISCITVGIGSLAAIGVLSNALTTSISGQGRLLLGGDVELSLNMREISEAEKSFLQSSGQYSAMAQLNAMSRAGDKQTLVTLKAVDSAYPLYGELQLTDEGRFSAEKLALSEGHFGALVDPELAARLNIAIGDPLKIGEAMFKVRGLIKAEPDRLTSYSLLGPRALISLDALKTTDLIQPGSLIRWNYRVRFAKNDPENKNTSAEQWTADLQKKFPEAGWRITDHTSAAKREQLNIDRFSQFLTMTAFMSMIVGGVGIANALRGYLRTKRETIAILRSVGASYRMIFNIFMIETFILSTIGIFLGLLVGVIIPILLNNYWGHLLPFPLNLDIDLKFILLLIAFGYLTVLTFSLLPLSQISYVKPLRLFRQQNIEAAPRPPVSILIAILVSALTLGAILLWMVQDQLIAIYFLIGTLIAFILLRGLAFVIMRIPLRISHSRSVPLAMALGNIRRVDSLTPSIILSLGLSLCLLITIAQIAANLRAEFNAPLENKYPSFFAFNITNEDLPRFLSITQTYAPDADIQSVPMLRGRFIDINGKSVSEITPPEGSEWAIRGDRGITYSAEVPENSTLVQGEWWPKDYDGEPLVSFESNLAKALNLSIGDRITVNILGRNITAKITSLRAVNWESLNINFVMVFSPNTLKGAPHSYLFTLTWKIDPNQSAEAITAKQELFREREQKIENALANDLPNTSIVSIRQLFETLRAIFEKLIIGIFVAAFISIITSIIVLAGAIRADYERRNYDMVILKILGATRSIILRAFCYEYLIISLFTGLFSLIIGTTATYLIVTYIMKINFTWQITTALLTAAFAILGVILLGLFSNWRILKRKAAPMLRNL